MSVQDQRIEEELERIKKALIDRAKRQVFKYVKKCQRKGHEMDSQEWVRLAYDVAQAIWNAIQQ